MLRFKVTKNTIILIGMLSLFLSKKSRSEVWTKVYNENKTDFHAKLTKVFEVISIASAIMAGLNTAFLTSSNEVFLQGFSMLSVSLSILSFTTSIILIVMINATEIRNMGLFIDDWSGMFIVPTLTTIGSCILTLTNVIFYVKSDVSYYIGPVIMVAVCSQVYFYCKIRSKVYEYSQIE